MSTRLRSLVEHGRLYLKPLVREVCWKVKALCTCLKCLVAAGQDATNVSDAD